MNDAVRTIVLPREIVLASAGAGKTFRISSRIIGLLAHGEPADAILASTFTRKAAGEILGRVLVRLARAALDPAAAEELATHAALDPGSPPELGCDRCLELLGDLVRRLHRLHVSTLDAFFIRAARTFSHELGLPPAWTIEDGPRYERLRAEAVHETLRGADPGALIEIVRLANRGDATRSIHRGVFSDLDRLLDVLHQVDPSVTDPWNGFDAYTQAGAESDGDSRDRRGDHGVEHEDVERAADGGQPAATTAVPDAAARLADAIDALEPPPNKSGTPNKRWANALAQAADSVRGRDWEALLGKGIGKKILNGEEEYYRKPIPDDVRALFDSAFDLARRDLAREFAAQSRALGRLVDLYRADLERQRRADALFRWTDVTRMLGGPDPLGERTDLRYRLDARMRHLLLDEFQDTSMAQWAALRPLVEHACAADEADRAAVVVADPKQSIYGWRDAEPALVHRVGERYGLARDTLARSWRSSQVVLDVVNDVFQTIASNPALEDTTSDRTESNRRVAEEWARSFEPHVAARELPGYVRIAVGPADEGRSEHRPRLLAHAADLVRDLHRDSPGFEIGVLTRTNKAVARLIHELRTRGVPASEEGGNPLTDAESVAAVLALLRMADHPGDRIARYHVARSPVGEAVGFTDHEDDAAARRHAHSIRRDLLRHGYGATLTALARGVAPDCDARQLRRLGQLVELGFRYDDEATLRPMDFVRRVEAERVEDPTQAAVRVMTVHQSKGLEFDVVVLPELDVSIFGGGGGGSTAALPYREEPAGPVTRIFPYVKGDAARLFPEVDEALRQSRGSVLRDALSGLYVAMTRARHALHIVIRPDEDGRRSGAFTAAAIVRDALAPDEEAVEGDAELYTHGDPEWFRKVPGRGEAAGVGLGAAAAGRPAPGAAGPDAIRLRLRPSSDRRTRLLARHKPSEHEDERLAHLLRLDDAEARRRGTIVHAWCEEIEWLDDGLPDDARLRETAARVAPLRPSETIDALIRDFRDWMAQPDVAKALRREAYRGELVAVERETPFVHRAGNVIVDGVIDRIVVWDDEESGRRRVDVLDFKTDDVAAGDALDARADRYRPQLASYGEAAAAMYGVDPVDVGARLVFVRAGAVVPV
ncbi:MAG: UvrD-helicase domain-containing protein [Gemmatimonadota bacterium]